MSKHLRVSGSLLMLLALRLPPSQPHPLPHVLCSFSSADVVVYTGLSIKWSARSVFQKRILGEAQAQQEGPSQLLSRIDNSRLICWPRRAFQYGQINSFINSFISGFISGVLDSYSACPQVDFSADGGKIPH